MIGPAQLAMALAVAAALLIGCPKPTSTNTPTAPPRAQKTKRPHMADSIGTATMNDDGTLVLRLRAEAEDGTVGEGFFTYAPGDPDYESVLKHLGGMKPGESRAVPPWDD